MKIIQLHAENVKRLKAVDITPDDNTIVISGKNENGKSSVIDAIWLALEYRAAVKKNPQPLRKGESKGIVTLDLGDYIVTRKFTESDSTLEIRTPDGSKITSPQKLLDGMIGDLSFDPWEFTRRSDDEQKQMLADVLYNITEGKLDLAAFDQRYKEAFDKRTDANREKKRLTTLLTTMTPPKNDDPTDEISSSDLAKSIADAVDLQARISSLVEKDKSVTERINALKTELTNLEVQQSLVTAELTKMPEVPDIAFLKSQLTDVESHNKRAREVTEYNKLRKALQLVDEDVGKLNDSMELCEIEKAEALEASPLPVHGLRITPEGVMITNDDNSLVPFCQASSARRLKISLAIAMAINPTLRVIRISDGSLLDDDSMQVIKDMASAQDFQVWVEYACRNENDRIGVYIEDGMIA